MRRDKTKTKERSWTRRAKRVRARIFGTAEKPRLSVFRSNAHIHLQLIDDEHGRTLVAADDLRGAKSSKKGRSAESVKNRKMEAAHLAGKLLAQNALAKKILKAVFDRGGYKYHGRVKAAAEGAREGGLKF